MFPERLSDMRTDLHEWNRPSAHWDNEVTGHKWEDATICQPSKFHQPNPCNTTRPWNYRTRLVESNTLHPTIRGGSCRGIFQHTTLPRVDDAANPYSRGTDVIFAVQVPCRTVPWYHNQPVVGLALFPICFCGRCRHRRLPLDFPCGGLHRGAGGYGARGGVVPHEPLGRLTHRQTWGPIVAVELAELINGAERGRALAPDPRVAPARNPPSAILPPVCRARRMRRAGARPPATRLLCRRGRGAIGAVGVKLGLAGTVDRLPT